MPSKIKKNYNNVTKYILPLIGIVLICIVGGIVISSTLSSSRKSSLTHNTTAQSFSEGQEQSKQPVIEESTYFELAEFDKINDTHSENPGKIETPRWATYTNATYDFSFQFPSEWHLYRDQMRLGTHLPDLPGPGNRYGITINVFENSQADLKTVVEQAITVNKNHNLRTEPKQMPVKGELIDMYYLPQFNGSAHRQGLLVVTSNHSIIEIQCDYCDVETVFHIASTLQSPRKHPGR